MMTSDEAARLEDENKKLRDTLKALVSGVHAELCSGRGDYECKECLMREANGECVMVDAMDVLCDMNSWTGL